ncbi:hypothetical protein [Paracoccus aerodenitrificans]|uniref:hypothetical protein n=1 Tax=Paracoccus aerodenitrificans TaxID=3017781 RepID=UPI0022F117EA|nr:hypothetical protein [Paracoccus aerodenitrificans]WBU63962.1 hypothetical protein PAE61_16780 [Paracoccus aerodenitrificans]
MVENAIMLTRLARLAELKADPQLRRLAAYRKQVAAMNARRDLFKAKLNAAFSQGSSCSLAELRLFSLEAGYAAAALAQVESELADIRPGLEQARKEAAIAFGRVQALDQLAHKANTEEP